MDERAAISTIPDRPWPVQCGAFCAVRGVRGVGGRVGCSFRLAYQFILEIVVYCRCKMASLFRLVFPVSKAGHALLFRLSPGHCKRAMPGTFQNQSMKLIIFLFAFIPAVCAAQIEVVMPDASQGDTTRGVALVIVEYTVRDTAGHESPVLNVVPVYCIRTRRPAQIRMEGNIQAFITAYFTLDGAVIPNDDIMIFKKR